MGINWDDGLEVPYQVLSDENCDLASPTLSIGENEYTQNIDYRFITLCLIIIVITSSYTL